MFLTLSELRYFNSLEKYMCLNFSRGDVSSTTSLQSVSVNSSSRFQIKALLPMKEAIFQTLGHALNDNMLITFWKALFPYQHVMSIITHHHSNLKSSCDNKFN